VFYGSQGESGEIHSGRRQDSVGDGSIDRWCYRWETAGLSGIRFQVMNLTSSNCQFHKKKRRKKFLGYTWEIFKILYQQNSCDNNLQNPQNSIPTVLWYLYPRFNLPSLRVSVGIWRFSCSVVNILRDYECKYEVSNHLWIVFAFFLFIM
jgi:hypothetical protein